MQSESEDLTAPFSLTLRYPDAMSEMEVTEAVAELEAAHIPVQREPQEPQVWAAFEWSVATLVEAVLSIVAVKMVEKTTEAAFEKLKQGVKKLAAFTRQRIHVRSISASQSTKKLKEGYSQSKAFSVVFTTVGGRSVRALFDERLTQAEWDTALDALLLMIAFHYQTQTVDQFGAIDRQAASAAWPVYAIIDPATKQWRLMNYKQMGAYFDGAPDAVEE